LDALPRLRIRDLDHDVRIDLAGGLGCTGPETAEKQQSGKQDTQGQAQSSLHIH